MSDSQAPRERNEPAQPPVYAPDFLTELFRNPLDQGYADAAKRKALAGEPRGWRATGVRLVSVLTLVAVGFLLVVAYKQTMADEPSRSQARAGLVDQIEQRQAATDDLQRDADGLRDEVARQRDAVLDDRDAARLRDQEAAAGMARVRGDGVEVRLDDAPDAVDAVTGEGKPDLGRVLDRDLQEIANALWSAGAEAIAINDQRLTATSTIRAAGSAILVDFRPVNRPYVVRAIGPGDMEDDFKDSATARLFRALVEDEGMSFSVRGVDDITLPAASDPQLRFATPSPTVAPTPTPTPEGGK